MKEILCSAKHIDHYTFQATSRTYQYFIDTSAAGGANKGPSPKELVLSAILVCSGMDIVGMLKKHKVSYDSFQCEGAAELGGQRPFTFTREKVKFKLDGDKIVPEKAIQAAQDSMTKYCSVSAMISKHCPIQYEVIINGKIVHSSFANFGEKA